MKKRTTKKKASTAAICKAVKKREKQLKAGPLWGGPEKEGVTQSMISSFLVCRERFRLRVIEGLDTPQDFNKNLEFGQMWHTCEEEYARNSHDDNWIRALLQYAKGLCKKYPLQQDQVKHWYRVCKVEFEVYLKWQAKQPKGRLKQTELLAEQTFEVPYELPSGRTVLLRGKWDGVMLLGSGKNGGIWLKEHKTKGDINEEQLQRQLTFDLQTMIYLVALHEQAPVLFGELRVPVKGLIYNVVRRPLSGGKGSIRQHKATKTKPEETADHFYGRVRGIIEEEPEHFFMKWDVTVSQADIDKFKTEFLNPCLENLCDWYEWVTSTEDIYSINTKTGKAIHWRFPYGPYSTILNGRVGDLDRYLIDGNEVGLVREQKLFPELE